MGLAVGKGSTHKGLTPAAQTSPSQHSVGLVGSVAPHCCERSPSTPHERVGLAVGKGSTHLGLAPNSQTSPSQHSVGLVGSSAPHSCERSPSTPHVGGERVGLAVGKGSTHKGLTPAAQTSPSQQTSGLVESVAPHCCERSPSTPQVGGGGVGLAVGKGSTHKGLTPAAQTRPGQHSAGLLELDAPHSWARSPRRPQFWAKEMGARVASRAILRSFILLSWSIRGRD